MASAKASAKIMAVWIFGAASGFRPMASAEREPIMPMAIAGPMAPIMIVPIAAHRRTVSKSILFSVDFPWTTFCFFRKCRGVKSRSGLIVSGFFHIYKELIFAPAGPAVLRKFRHELPRRRSEEHTSELQSHVNLVCRHLL